MLIFAENKRRSGLMARTNPRVVLAGGVIPAAQHGTDEAATSPQVVTASSDTIGADQVWVLVNRTAPSTTSLALPDASGRGGIALRIADFSTSVTDHTITLTLHASGQKVMRQSTWPLYSNSANLASVTLWPVVDPDDASNYVWIIAP